jgi:hypothetical protein
VTPHACVILAIDPGKVSGWSIFVDGNCFGSGVAKTHEHRALAVKIALAYAETSVRPLVVVGEVWTPGGKFAGARTMAGLGAQWGLWLAALEAAGVAKARVLRVKTQTWRAKVLGGGWGITKAQWDARSQRRAALELCTPGPVDDNEAEAVCIGIWATRAAEVARKLPAKRTTRRIA